MACSVSSLSYSLSVTRICLTVLHEASSIKRTVLTQIKPDIVIFTANVLGARGGYVFTDVCLLTGGGVHHLHSIILPLVLCPEGHPLVVLVDGQPYGNRKSSGEFRGGALPAWPPPPNGPKFLQFHRVFRKMLLKYWAGAPS